MIDRTALRGLAAAVTFFLVACGPKITVPPLAPHEVAEFRAIGNLPHAVYRVEPGDTIQIRYPFHSGLDQTQIVRPDGTIRAREIGEVVIGGLTTGEIEATLVQRSSPILRDPEVSVSVIQFSPKSVYVAGEVGLPGPIPYRKGLTPLQAIIQAGGLRDTALAKSVVLIRATEPPGSYRSRLLDVDQILHEGAPEPLALAPRDVVFVPRSGIAEANVWMDQHVTQLLPFFRGASTSVEIAQPNE